MPITESDIKALAQVAVLRQKRRELSSLRARREHPELNACRASFKHFLRYWKFKNRETGEVLTFETLWEGQEEFADIVQEHAWVFALKAGKLGFTELECAYDAWAALFKQPNATVALFSKEQKAARSLLRYVQFGLSKLPSWFGISFVVENTEELSFTVHGQPDDVRTIRSFAVTGHAAIDISLTHAHVDELSQMQFAEDLWSSVNTVIAPGGSCHVVTRGAGDGVYSATLWNGAKAAPERLWGSHGYLYPFFVPWDKRPPIPERDKERLAESGSFTPLGLSYFLPSTPEEALQGDGESGYIPVQQWDRCHDPELPPLDMGSREPCVVAIDAATYNDCFAVVVATRHPAHPDKAAIRLVKLWRPSEENTGVIDLNEPDRYVRWLCQGGCPNGHPRSKPMVGARDMLGNPLEDCPSCVEGDWSVPPLNVMEVAYDPYQMDAMAQDMVRDGIWGLDAFDQGTERLIADSNLYKLAMRLEVFHNGSPALREHIGNCKAKLQKDEESRMRIIKKGPAFKVDAAVAASMAVKRILDVNV